MESQKRPSGLIFVVLNFMTATQSRAWHYINNDVYKYTRSISFAIFLIMKPHLQRLGQKSRKIFVLRMPLAG